MLKVPQLRYLRGHRRSREVLPFGYVIIISFPGAEADSKLAIGHGALTGTFTEVSCSQWSGSDGGQLWNGACLTGETAANWPAVACGNKGELKLGSMRKSDMLIAFVAGTAPS